MVKHYDFTRKSVYTRKEILKIASLEDIIESASSTIGADENRIKEHLEMEFQIADHQVKFKAYPNKYHFNRTNSQAKTTK